jgi:membrane protease YdiL (CAAX protease family)
MEPYLLMGATAIFVLNFIKMKYFREYPWGLQLFLFLMMVVTMASFVTVLLIKLMPVFSPYTIYQIGSIDEHSPAALIHALLIVQGLSSLFTFLIPAGLFAYLTHPQPAEYLGLRAPGKRIHWLLAPAMILGAMPALNAIPNLVSLIDFGPKIKASQAANDKLMEAFLTMPNISAFLLTFLVTAILPAVGEELFFRGVMMRFTKKKTNTMVIPFVFTAAIFAYSHTNIYGILSIFLAGVLLAYIYYITGSLWCSILAHLLFNGSTILLSYLGAKNPGIKAFINNGHVQAYLVIGGLALFGISLYLLLKNKTPLPEDWTDDFPPQEPEEEEWDFASQN